MYLALAPVLALYASGRKSGVTLDSGHGSTSSVPIHEGFAVVKNILRVDLGGEYLAVPYQSNLDKTYCFPHMVELSPLVEQSVSRCPESLFHPPPANTGLTGIHQLV